MNVCVPHEQYRTPRLPRQAAETLGASWKAQWQTEESQSLISKRLDKNINQIYLQIKFLFYVKS